ncbi:MAG TPA: precorrin-6Y C5,15-methyltransferase (decarboxylating) subunit CbiT [Candidatus Luteococcus avicola]|nr:precorrin-6Y C5,15-methyltransferase (decarboxylating) subunit CbiT [Candidatus Luteococcus avicola]
MDACRVTVVGIGADGWDGLGLRSQQLVTGAAVLIGAPRQLALVPEVGVPEVGVPEVGVPEVGGQRRLEWPRPLKAGLGEMVAGLAGLDVVALASGDPLVSGIGTTLVMALGADRVRIVPAVSSVALARAELRWPAESCAVVSVVGRPVSLVARELAPGHRVLVLGSDGSTAGLVAGLLCEQGFGASVMHLLGDLGSQSQSHRVVRADEFTGEGPRLGVIALDLVGPRRLGWVPGLPDDAFENDGQLTKRDLRASALARLAPVPGEHLWDVGAGAGSIGIEWARAHPTCRTTAIEGDVERAARIERNAARLGVPGLRVVHGRVPEALDGLDAPHAIFIGGGTAIPGLLDQCLAALQPGGRLVAHAVTLESEQALASAHAEHGGELTRIAVEKSAPVGRFTGWTPARTVTQWSVELGGEAGSAR